jgi:subtilase family serine protease
MKRISLVIVLLFALLALLIPSAPVAAAKEPQASTTFHIHGVPKAKYLAGSAYSPSQIRHAYGIDSLTATGANQTIAIVDAYGSPTIAKDLSTFCTQFGLPPANLTIKSYGKSTDAGWALETSLDVEWAHALAPGAPILLEEAASANFSDLFAAINDATSKQGTKVVSMSWVTGDFAGELSYDFNFNSSGIVYLASSGDSGSVVGYPATSPYVTAVGGTSLPLDTLGNLTGAETAWSGSGGGISSYEAEPIYQLNYNISNTHNMRETPDVAFDGDPATGVAVYDSTPYSGSSGWSQIGGTSVGSPCWAGIIALADQSASTPLSSNNLSSSPLYNAANISIYASNYRDIKAPAPPAGVGYDTVTGLGSPLANKLVPYLANPVPDFSLSISPASQSVVQGNGTIYTITLSPSGGFSGSVSLSISGLPSGANGSFNPTSISGSGSSALTVTTASSTPTGTYTLTISGTNGTLTHNTTATLVVTAPVPSLLVKVGTNNSSYNKGSTVTITVTVTSSGTPVNRSSVGLTITTGGSRVSNQSGRTNSSGVVQFSYRIPNNASSGTTYTVQANASASGYTSGSGSTTFKVN